jgi:hypothetical protein
MRYRFGTEVAFARNWRCSEIPFHSMERQKL